MWFRNIERFVCKYFVSISFLFFSFLFFSFLFFFSVLLIHFTQLIAIRSNAFGELAVFLAQASYIF